LFLISIRTFVEFLQSIDAVGYANFYLNVEVNSTNFLSFRYKFVFICRHFVVLVYRFNNSSSNNNNTPISKFFETWPM